MEDDKKALEYNPESIRDLSAKVIEHLVGLEEANWWSDGQLLQVLLVAGAALARASDIKIRDHMTAARKARLAVQGWGQV